MIENDSSLFKVDIDNYNGPLDILLDLAKAQNDCETSCEFKVIFTDLTSTQCVGSYCPNGFMSTNQYVKLETFTSDEISSDLVLTVAPWILGGIYMIIALASTPLWNPIFSETKRRFNNA